MLATPNFHSPTIIPMKPIPEGDAIQVQHPATPTPIPNSLPPPSKTFVDLKTKNDKQDVFDLQDKVKDAKRILQTNVHSLAERGEALHSLEARSVGLAERTSVAFHKSTKQLARKLRWQSRKMTLVIVMIVVFLVVMLVVAGMMWGLPIPHRFHVR